MTEEAVQQLGNYRLTDLLGQGGFAKVYLGEHIYLQMKAAVKVLQTHVSGSDDMDSFLKEARIIASLTHSNIVRVLDFGIDGETPFLVMDYAPNGTLRQRHPKGTRLALPTIVSYVKQVADALQYAHDKRFIHRDIKPENILLGPRNEILLSDFGIALVTQSSQYHSNQGVVGTVPYMSPEHIQGKARPASDQYSLGIVVYEWLSGDRPFQGSFVELCTQHLFRPVPPLLEKVPTILPEVEQVVLKALAKDPKQRFNSVQAFADALEQASQLGPKAVISLPQPLPNDTSTSFSESASVSEAFSLALQKPSKEQVAIKTIEKESKQHLDSFRMLADPLELASEASPKVIVPLSPSLSPNASMPLLESIPFTEGSLLSNVGPLNLQSSKQQVVRQISQKRQIFPNNADMAINLLERAKKYNADMTINILERARKRGASIAGIAPDSTNTAIETQSIGQREIILIILGIVVFGILKYDADQLIIHHSILFSSSIGNLPYFPSYGDLLFHDLAFAVAFFLGVKFGSWAGCACVLIGSLSGDILTGYILQAHWYQYVADILIVFISGLSSLSTYGRYNTKKSVCIAIFMSLFAIFVGNYFLYILYNISTNSFTLNSIPLILTNSVGSLISLILLLIIDESFIGREERKAHRISGTRANGTVTSTERS